MSDNSDGRLPGEPKPKLYINPEKYDLDELERYIDKVQKAKDAGVIQGFVVTHGYQPGQMAITTISINIAKEAYEKLTEDKL